ncbi:hypothetical protein GCM10020358_49690 [Amorphoplanes nipponensis]|uniref:Uncharacterized protein n=1 Tax=Actinoplanes nipponensis TaxID=135950 RepID=A0A919MPZ0_9ACTN|nr:hypothetical protein Ani05nite_66400 [Actinoplanes nipponensis]
MIMPHGFGARRLTGAATIRWSADGPARLPALADAAVVRAVTATASGAGPDGWVEATIPSEHTARACQELLRPGAATGRSGRARPPCRAVGPGRCGACGDPAPSSGTDPPDAPR